MPKPSVFVYVVYSWTSTIVVYVHIYLMKKNPKSCKDENVWKYLNTAKALFVMNFIMLATKW